MAGLSLVQVVKVGNGMMVAITAKPITQCHSMGTVSDKRKKHEKASTTEMRFLLFNILVIFLLLLFSGDLKWRYNMFITICSVSLDERDLGEVLPYRHYGGGGRSDHIDFDLTPSMTVLLQYEVLGSIFAKLQVS